MSGTGPIVFVVDDDASVRDAIMKLLSSVGLRTETFGSTGEFLRAKRPDAPSCLVLDVRLPDVSGLEFQRELTRAGIQIPIVFITGHGDIPMTVQAMKAGAVQFLTKPFRGQELLDAIHEAIAKDREDRGKREVAAEIAARYESVTAREKEVMNLVVSGLLNKQVAAELGMSELTVKTHRGRVMEKMKADSLADLVRMSEQLKSAGGKQ